MQAIYELKFWCVRAAYECAWQAKALQLHLLGTGEVSTPSVAVSRQGEACS